MGIIPVPDTPGDNCALCFLPGATPNLLKLFLSGIELGDNWHPGDLAAPNGYWDLTQSLANPCNFTKIDPESVTSVAYSPNLTVCSFARPACPPSFFSNPAVECEWFFINVLQGPVGNKFYGGFGMVTTPQQMEAWLNLVTPTTGPDPRLELYPMDSGEIVLKFCNIQDGTNIKIKLDTALL